MANRGSRDGGCAVVTGASRGIGAATALALAREGWPVAVNYRADADAAASVVATIEAEGGRALAVQADVSVPGAEDQLFDAVEEGLGPVLALVNSAGMRADNLSPALSDEEWSSVMSTNLDGAFRNTRRALRAMLRQRFGRIVNIASIVGPRANAGQANYAASKAGLIGFTKTVSAEVAKRGITVNAVAPGFVDTEMTADVNRDFLTYVPARRAGTPEEVAACVRFLVSDDASYVTGQTLTVDGGLSA